MRCKFKMSQLKELTCLKLAIHMCSWICEDAPKKKLSYSGLWGSNPQDIKQAQSRMVFHPVAVKIFIGAIPTNNVIFFPIGRKDVAQELLALLVMAMLGASS
jgi:hypothetical protein